jgi:hypothetical protein
MDNMTLEQRVECFCICPDCGSRLTYIPEWVHIGDHRPVFKCDNKTCPSYREELRDRLYMVLGNVDNFGHGPMTKEEYYGKDA